MTTMEVKVNYKLWWSVAKLRGGNCRWTFGRHKGCVSLSNRFSLDTVLHAIQEVLCISKYRDNASFEFPIEHKANIRIPVEFLSLILLEVISRTIWISHNFRVNHFTQFGYNHRTHYIHQRYRHYLQIFQTIGATRTRFITLPITLSHTLINKTSTESLKPLNSTKTDCKPRSIIPIPQWTIRVSNGKSNSLAALLDWFPRAAAPAIKNPLRKTQNSSEKHASQLAYPTTRINRQHRKNASLTRWSYNASRAYSPSRARRAEPDFRVDR